MLSSNCSLVVGGVSLRKKSVKCLTNHINTNICMIFKRGRQMSIFTQSIPRPVVWCHEIPFTWVTHTSHFGNHWSDDDDEGRIKWFFLLIDIKWRDYKRRRLLSYFFIVIGDSLSVIEGIFRGFWNFSIQCRDLRFVVSDYRGEEIYEEWWCWLRCGYKTYWWVLNLLAILERRESEIYLKNDAKLILI